MLTKEEIYHYLRTLPVDTRIEVVVASLIDKGLNPDDLTIKPVGLSRRRFHKDWEAVDPIQAATGIVVANIDEEDEQEDSRLVISVNREGLYDYLPEGVVHQPRQTGKSDPEKVVQEIKEERQREQAARRFFLPIEQEFYRLRVVLEQEEGKYFVTPENIANHDLIQQFWEIPSFLTARQTCNLIHLFPMIHRIVGDNKLTELCFEAMLNVPVTIRNSYPLNHDLPHTLSEKEVHFDDLWAGGLGSQRMAVDFVLSGGSYQETIPSIIVKVGPVPLEEMDDFVSCWFGNQQYRGIKRQTLDYLIELFLPFEADAFVELHTVSGKEKGFVLSDDSGNQGALMGFDFL